MLFSVSTGLLNIFIEPQFKNLCGEPLYTVQSAEPISLSAVRPPSFAEFRIQLDDPLFQFNAFVYSWNLEHILDLSVIRRIETLPENVNPVPMGFCYQAETLLDEPEDDLDGECFGTTQVGYVLANQLQEKKLKLTVEHKKFRFFPVYRRISKKDLETIWTN
jgi:hypothetical protein